MPGRLGAVDIASAAGTEGPGSADKMSAKCQQKKCWQTLHQVDEMSEDKLLADKMSVQGEPLWLSGTVEKNEKINEIERSRVCSPPPQWSENFVWAKKFQFSLKFCPQALFDIQISFYFIKLVKKSSS
jgi:hypothetical protein